MRAVTSASNLSRRKLCPGSAALEANIQNENTAYSEEGTMLHWADANLLPEQWETLGKLHPNQLHLLRKNRALRDKFFQATQSELKLDGMPFQEFVEESFDLCDEDGMPLDPRVPGHPDRIQWYPSVGVAVIFDSKFGYLPVAPAETNLQLRHYLVAFAEMFPVKIGVVAITQPRLKSPEDFHSAKYTAAQIEAAKGELLEIVKATKEPNAPRNPSLAACRYCKAKGFCHEALMHAAALATEQINAMTIEEMESVSEAIELSTIVAEAWKGRMKQIALAHPGVLKFHALADEQFTRACDRNADAYLKLRSAGLLHPDEDKAQEEFNSCLKLSVSKLEELVAKHRGLSEKDAKQRMDDCLGQLIVKKPKERKLIRINK